MLVRIVKLTFKEETLPAFFQEFEIHKNTIASFPGCRGMRLLKGIDEPTVIMTYSHWDSEEALNTYRNSPVFIGLWNKIKPYFGDRPEAWSHEIYFDGMNSK